MPPPRGGECDRSQYLLAAHRTASRKMLAACEPTVGECAFPGVGSVWSLACHILRVGTNGTFEDAAERWKQLGVLLSKSVMARVASSPGTKCKLVFDALKNLSSVAKSGALHQRIRVISAANAGAYLRFLASCGHWTSLSRTAYRADV